MKNPRSLLRYHQLLLLYPFLSESDQVFHMVVDNLEELGEAEELAQGEREVGPEDGCEVAHSLPSLLGHAGVDLGAGGDQNPDERA
jgi:hypothetical protein